MSLRPIKPFGLQWIKIEPIRVNHARPDSSSCIGSAYRKPVLTIIRWKLFLVRSN